MKIHEYQAKEILSRFGVPVPQGQVVTDPDDATTHLLSSIHFLSFVIFIK